MALILIISETNSIQDNFKMTYGMEKVRFHYNSGTLKYSNGDFFTGTFRHGRINESMNCSYKWVDGSVFNGWFKNNKPDKGTVRNPQ